MSSNTATTTTATLAGLGLTFDSASVASSFSSGEESFDSLFSNVSLASESSHGSASPSDDNVDPPEGDADAPAAEPAERRGHWHITYDSDWDSSEPEVGFNYFEPYLGLPEVSDFMPWPTSTDQAHTASSEAQAPAQSDHQSIPATPNDRGYETDTDSPRAQRRQRRRDAHKSGRRRRERVQYLVEHVEPIIEELPSLEEILARIAANASPAPEEEEQTLASEALSVGLGLGLPAFDEAERVVSASELELEDSDDEFSASALGAEIEQDITDYVYYASDADSDSGCDSDDLHRRSDDEYDSDSDSDHYYGEGYEDGADSVDGSGEVHYLVTHVRPIIEDLPTLEELQARMEYEDEDSGDDELEVREVAQATIGLGLGLPVDESPRIAQEQEDIHNEVDLAHSPVPFHVELVLPTAPVATHHYDGFETIDLTDSPPAQPQAQHPHAVPDSPDLRPHPLAESPSPIVLASPMPVAAFRRFDDVLHHNPWVEAESEVAYAAPHPLAMSWEERE
ncbi:hypothetical protein OH77DRAFT_1594057 [Trametes cingulata]|nr:hypothetical protein OH77DRAFT_1594057 [Trametes cingulata]